MVAARDEPSARAPRPCPLCGAGDATLIREQDGWPLVTCRPCQMTYLARSLSYAEQAAAHEWLAAYEAEHARRQTRRGPARRACSRVLRRLRPDRVQRMLAQVLRYSAGGRLIDLGCGLGELLAAARGRFEVTGVDLSEPMLAEARRRLPDAELIHAPITAADLPAESYDVAVMISMLEHEWQPLEALGVARRCLRPGGVLVIKVPNYASWPSRWFGADWCCYRVPEHCNYFTPQTLAQALRTAGFEPVRGSWRDTLPTSDNLWAAARRPMAEAQR